MKRKFKLQSAMEYLMTYGWAILIIAVVLGALFSLGVFNGAALLGTSCVASSGYTCQSPVYLHATGNLIITFGQNTGATWTAVNAYFVNQTTVATMQAGGVTALALPSNQVVTGTATFVSGETKQINLPVSPSSTTIGTAVSGYIWVIYTQSGQQLYSQVATVTAKAS